MTIRTIIPEPLDGMERLDQWLSKREEIKSRFLHHIGKPNFPRKPQDIETVATVECGSYTRHKLHYKVGDKDQVRAYLFVPHSITAPAPAILAMHQMNNYGKDEVAGLLETKIMPTVMN
jgi:hypothetical protein